MNERRKLYLKPVEWILVGLISVACTLFVQWFTEKQSLVVYGYASGPIVDNVFSGTQDLIVSIGGAAVGEPYYSAISIRNAGDLNHTDVKFYFDMQADIISYYMSSDRPAIRDSILWSTENGVISVEVPTLNSGEELDFIILHDGPMMNKLSVDVAVPGMRLQDAAAIRRTTTKKLSYVFAAGTMAIVILIFFAISYLIETRTELKLLRAKQENRN